MQERVLAPGQERVQERVHSLQQEWKAGPVAGGLGIGSVEGALGPVWGERVRWQVLLEVGGCLTLLKSEKQVH